MTCIVGIVDDCGDVYMGCDSLGSNSHNKSVRKDTKLFSKGNMLIGFTSSYRMGQLLKYKLVLPEHNDGIDAEEYLITSFMDSVIECLTNNGFITADNNDITGCEFMIAYDNRLFVVHDDFQVAESVLPYSSVGSGQECAEGAMSALLKYNKNIDKKQLLYLALKSAEENICTVQGPFKIMRLKNK